VKPWDDFERPGHILVGAFVAGLMAPVILAGWLLSGEGRP
jgi:hypothetical protein